MCHFSSGLAHATTLPPYWVTKDLGSVVARQYESGYKRAVFETLLRSTAHIDSSMGSGCTAKCLHTAEIISIQRNENVRLWKGYQRKRAEMVESDKATGIYDKRHPETSCWNSIMIGKPSRELRVGTSFCQDNPPRKRLSNWNLR